MDSRFERWRLKLAAERPDLAWQGALYDECNEHSGVGTMRALIGKNLTEILVRRRPLRVCRAFSDGFLEEPNHPQLRSLQWPVKMAWLKKSKMR